jgi:hypothetical protein
MLSNAAYSVFRRTYRMVTKRRFRQGCGVLSTLVRISYNNAIHKEHAKLRGFVVVEEIIISL